MNFGLSPFSGVGLAVLSGILGAVAVVVLWSAAVDVLMKLVRYIREDVLGHEFKEVENRSLEERFRESLLVALLGTGAGVIWVYPPVEGGVGPLVFSWCIALFCFGLAGRYAWKAWHLHQELQGVGA